MSFTPSTPSSDLAGPSQQASGPIGASRSCKPFNLQRFENELLVDGIARWGIILLIIAMLFAFQDNMSTAQMWLLTFLLVGGWLIISLPGTKAMRLLPQLWGLIEHDPSQAETAIAMALARRPLSRQMRLELYHRLALLRHTQGRFDESTQIIEALLTRPLGRVERYRSPMLLMLVEARLVQNHLPGAYLGLVELSKMSLPLIESLGRLSLRTWYDVAADHYGQALDDIAEKIRMAQMMPVGACGQMHLMLAMAAKRQGDQGLYDWLYRRAELLCDPRQFEAFSKGLWQIRSISTIKPGY